MRAGWSLEEFVAERRKNFACCLAKMGENRAALARATPITMMHRTCIQRSGLQRLPERPCRPTHDTKGAKVGLR